MRASRGMGAMLKSKMPKGKTITRKDNPDKVTEYAKGGWIKDAISKPGALRKQMGVKKGQKIPAKKLAKAASEPGILGKRARLAMTLGKLRNK